MTGTSEPTMRPGSQSSLVRHAYSYFTARQDPDGALVHSGPKRGEGYHYTAPDGTCCQRNWTYHNDGSPTGIIGYSVTGPVVNGKQVSTLTIINHASRTYGQQRTEYPLTGGANAPAPGLESSPPEVRQALQGGQATEKGTTTVNGAPVIALSVTMPRRMRSARSARHFTLYVDARTYQPLRTVTVVDGNPGGPYIADWMPATPGNIAKTEGDSIPADYTKVDIASALERA